MKLYDYWRSSAAYRVRIALALKGIPVETQVVDLRLGQQSLAGYLAHTPQGLVPALETVAGVLCQSLAIIEYLDDVHPEPPLLPADPWARAQVRQLALAVACDIHPLNNLRVLKYLEFPMGQTPNAVQHWYRHWLKPGLDALEVWVGQMSDGFCWGNRPTLADACLIPQLYNARRFDFDLSLYPMLLAVEHNCLLLPAFSETAPEAVSPD